MAERDNSKGQTQTSGRARADKAAANDGGETIGTTEPSSKDLKKELASMSRATCS